MVRETVLVAVLVLVCVDVVVDVVVDVELEVPVAAANADPQALSVSTRATTTDTGRDRITRAVREGQKFYEGDHEQYPGHGDQTVACDGDRKPATDPDQEQHSGQQYGQPDVLVGRAGSRLTLSEELVRLRVEDRRRRLLRDLVLRHVGRVGRSVGVLERVGCEPGEERGLVPLVVAAAR